jgi:outer membrane biosynthesis protein TonB
MRDQNVLALPLLCLGAGGRNPMKKMIRLESVLALIISSAIGLGYSGASAWANEEVKKEQPAAVSAGAGSGEAAKEVKAPESQEEKKEEKKQEKKKEKKAKKKKGKKAKKEEKKEEEKH